MITKTYVLDTNVLLSDGGSLLGFEEHNIVLPLIVLEELDRHKDRQDEVGRNARETVRRLAALTKHINGDGSEALTKTGVAIGPGHGTLRILSISDLAVSKLPVELEAIKSGDNTIIHFCTSFLLAFPEETMVLVTRDTVLSLKAKTLGIRCENYRRLNATFDASGLYSGVAVIENNEHITAQQLYGPEPVHMPEYIERDLHPNQFVIVRTGQSSAMARWLEPGVPLKPLDPITKTLSKLVARNKEQSFARELLFDPTIKLVTLSGPAGTGKTILSISAGLEQVLNTRTYKSLIICRPVMPVGRDIGFLPGSLSEKLEPWLAPIKDNLRFLLSDMPHVGDGVHHSSGGFGATPRRTRHKSGSQQDSLSMTKAEREHHRYNEQILQSYFEDGIIEVQALSFIRGRSIANAFILVDETQNTNLHEIKTILTRCGENTKIVLTGDPAQIDAPNIDSVSNGLSIVVERFKNCAIAGHVSLMTGERSELATLASKVLET